MSHRNLIDPNDLTGSLDLQLQLSRMLNTLEDRFIKHLDDTTLK